MMLLLKRGMKSIILMLKDLIRISKEILIQVGNHYMIRHLSRHILRDMPRLAQQRSI